MTSLASVTDQHRISWSGRALGDAGPGWAFNPAHQQKHSTDEAETLRIQFQVSLLIKPQHPRIKKLHVNYCLVTCGRSGVADGLCPCIINTGPGGSARDDLLVRVSSVNLGWISLLWSGVEPIPAGIIEHLIGSLSKDFEHLGRFQNMINLGWWSISLSHSGMRKTDEREG